MFLNLLTLAMFSGRNKARSPLLYNYFSSFLLQFIITEYMLILLSFTRTLRMYRLSDFKVVNTLIFVIFYLLHQHMHCVKYMQIQCT